MSRRKRAAPRYQGNTLSFAQLNELLIGPCPFRASVFPTDDERRAAWYRHRDDLIALTRDTGGPWALWHFDGPDHLHDVSTSHLATVEEAIEVEMALDDERRAWLVLNDTDTNTWEQAT